MADFFVEEEFLVLLFTKIQEVLVDVPDRYLLRLRHQKLNRWRRPELLRRPLLVRLRRPTEILATPIRHLTQILHGLKFLKHPRLTLESRVHWRQLFLRTVLNSRGALIQRCEHALIRRALRLIPRLLRHPQIVIDEITPARTALRALDLQLSKISFWVAIADSLYVRDLFGQYRGRLRLLMGGIHCVALVLVLPQE